MGADKPVRASGGEDVFQGADRAVRIKAGKQRLHTSQQVVGAGCVAKGSRQPREVSAEGICQIASHAIREPLIGIESIAGDRAARIGGEWNRPGRQAAPPAQAQAPTAAR